MSQSLEQGQNDRAEKYARMGSRYESERYNTNFRKMYLSARNRALQKLVAASSTGSRKRILEVGCGTGLSLQFLGECNPHCVFEGVDISETMLEQARAKIAEDDDRFQFKVASAFDLPFKDESFDVLLNTRFMHQFTIDEQTRIHMEFRRVVRPGGLIISEFYGARAGRHASVARHRERYPSREQVRAIVGGAYKVVPLSFRGQQFVANRLSAGLSALLGTVLTQFNAEQLVHEYFSVVTGENSDGPQP